MKVTQDVLRALAAKMLEAAKRNLVSDSDLVPTVMLCRLNGWIKFVLIDTSSAAGKAASAAALHAICRRHPPDVVCMMSEAWFEQKLPGEEVDLRKGTDPARRVEAILVCARSADEQLATATEFLRLPGKQFSFKEPVPMGRVAHNRFFDNIPFNTTTEVSQQ